MLKEIWKSIPNFEKYQVSDLGNVISLDFNKTKQTKPLSKFKGAGDYLYVKLTKNGIGYRKSVHGLVMLTFVGENEFLEINHKNGIKSDNRLENLEYCTRSENIQHAYNTGLKIAPHGENHIKARKVKQLLNGKIIKIYNCISDADKDGFQHSKIVLCCQGKRNKHKGYNWEYI